MKNPRIKPSYSLTKFYYNCPNCNAELCFMETELKFRNHKWDCGCGTSFIIKRIKKVHTKVEFWSRKKYHINNLGGIYKILIAMGYNKVDCIKFYKKHKKSLLKLSKEDILRMAILELNNK